MKNTKKRIILFIGILAAILSLMAVNSKASVSEDPDITRDSYRLAEEICSQFVTESDNIEEESGIRFRIYSKRFIQIYESNNKYDVRLQKLLIKSDLLTEIDQVKYYKLSR